MGFDEGLSCYCVSNTHAMKTIIVPLDEAHSKLEELRAKGYSILATNTLEDMVKIYYIEGK